MELKKKFFLMIFLIIISLLISSLKYVDTFYITEIYQHKIYANLNSLISIFFNVFTFSVGDVVYGIVAVYIFYKLFFYIKNKYFKNLIFFVINGFLFFYIFFNFFWGINNYKTSAFEQLKLDRGYTKEQLIQQTDELIFKVNKLQKMITKKQNAKVIINENIATFNKIAISNYNKLPENLSNILVNNQLNLVKPSIYSSLLSYTGFSGYFNPFTHENQINKEIPTIGMPITIAHEISHQLGIASETEANFFGYFVMLQSDDFKYKYAANLYALKYCLKELRNENEEIFQTYYSKLNKGVQHNIEDSEKFWLSKRNISSHLFKNLYGSFLKINNQKDGIRSYNKFVDLLINYNKKYEIKKHN